MKYGLLTRCVPAGWLGYMLSPSNLVPRAFPLKLGGAPHLQGKSPGNEVEVLLHIDRPRHDTAAIFLW